MFKLYRIMPEKEKSDIVSEYLTFIATLLSI